MRLDDQLKATLTRVAEAYERFGPQAYERFAGRRARRTVAAMLGTSLVVGLLVTAAVIPPRNVVGQSPAFSPSVQSTLVQAATRMRDSLGNPDVAKAEVYETTAREWSRASAQAPPPGPDQEVYVLVLRGHFTCNLCSHPLGARAPSGTIATLVLDHRSFRTLEFGINSKLDVSRLGPRHTISLS
jgi:hypothetical protein